MACCGRRAQKRQPPVRPSGFPRVALPQVFLRILPRKQGLQSMLMFLDSRQPIKPASAAQDDALILPQRANPSRMGFSGTTGHLEMFLSERNFRPIRRVVFRPKSRVSPRCVTAGRTLERRHCLPGLHQRRVEVTAASALPSDLHRQLDDRRGDLRQCLNALCPEFRFGHWGLSRFGFEWCHASSGAVRTVCMLAGAAIGQSPVVRRLVKKLELKN
jgi:hypothetical protein